MSDKCPKCGAINCKDHSTINLAVKKMAPVSKKKGK
jgi:hypothetical protein